MNDNKPIKKDTSSKKLNISSKEVANPERRRLINKLAKAAAIAPVASFLYDATVNTAYATT